MFNCQDVNSESVCRGMFQNAFSICNTHSRAMDAWLLAVRWEVWSLDKLRSGHTEADLSRMLVSLYFLSTFKDIFNIFDFIDLLVFFTFLNACTFFIFSFRFIAYFMRFIPSGFLPCVSHSMNIRKVFTSQRQQVMRLQLQQKLFQVPSFILVGLYNQAVGMWWNIVWMINVWKISILGVLISFLIFHVMFEPLIDLSRSWLSSLAGYAFLCI